jgi:hypothetical protein
MAILEAALLLMASSKNFVHSKVMGQQVVMKNSNPRIAI